MALRYGYFDSDIIGTDDEGMPIFDRAETSDLFALLFASLVSDGVLALPANCFRVSAAGNGLTLNIDPGFGMVRGHFCFNDEVSQLTLETAPQTYSRIDRVVMRCNYLDRVVEIVVKTGTEAASPAPPELIRPAAGDYYELCLANIRLAAGQRIVTQSSITDTRADKAVCGFITQLIDHLDTTVFFAQLNAFYKEFMERSNTSYEQFVADADEKSKRFSKLASDLYDRFNSDVSAYIAALKQNSADAYADYLSQMNDYFTGTTQAGQALYDQYVADINTFWTQIKESAQTQNTDFNTQITRYIAELTAKGNTDLAAITQQLLNFRNQNEADFQAWFENIQDTLDGDTAGKLQNQINDLTTRLDDAYTMLITGMVNVLLQVNDGDYLTTDTGIPLLVGWPICKCNK